MGNETFYWDVLTLSLSVLYLTLLYEYLFVLDLTPDHIDHIVS